MSDPPRGSDPGELAGQAQPPARVPSSREQRIRRRALKHLREALRQAGDQLSPSWVARDLDLRPFREPYDPRNPPRDRPEPDPEWIELVERGGVDVGEPRRRLSPPVLTRRTTPIDLPPRPWNPVLRVLFWIVVALAFGLLLVLAATNDAHWIFMLAPILGMAFSVYRGSLAALERLRIPDRARFERTIKLTSERLDRERAERPDREKPEPPRKEPPDDPLSGP